jgi:hypothetical protein
VTAEQRFPVYPSHTTHVIADTLVEAGACGLKAIRGSEWAGEIPGGIHVVTTCGGTSATFPNRELSPQAVIFRQRNPQRAPVIAGAQ